MGLIVNNIDLITFLKDSTDILFGVTATILAILTYLRAKETILQPVRTEVIQKQSRLMIELLEYLDSRSKDFPGDGIGYLDLVGFNLFNWARLFGFRFNHGKDLENTMTELSANAAKIFKDTIQLSDLEVVQPFNNKNRTDEELDRQAEKMWYERGSSGDYRIDRVFLTKQYVEYTSTLEKYKNDPFTPSIIKTSLDKLLFEIQTNIETDLRSQIQDFVKVLFKTTDKSGFNFSPAGVYNDFNHKRVRHDATLKELRENVRKYLKIDSMP